MRITARFSRVQAGTTAALATTPFDVIKTVRQQQGPGSDTSYRSLLAFLRKNPACSFAGVGPRLIRVPSGLAVMMSAIEMTRSFFERRRAEELRLLRW